MHIEFFYSYIALRHLKPNNIISAMQTILAIPPTPLAIAPRGIIFLFESHLYIANDQMIVFSGYLFFCWYAGIVTVLRLNSDSSHRSTVENVIWPHLSRSPGQSTPLLQINT